MAGKCPAGGIHCEHFKKRPFDTDGIIGGCTAQLYSRAILGRDTQCMCPKLQKEISGKFKKSWIRFIHLSDDQALIPEETFYQALREGGLKDD